MINKNPIWVEHHRPLTINECILPFRIKQTFLKYIENGEISSNLLLVGAPGLGKTSIAKAAMNELDAEFIFINASLSGNIDTIRYEVQSFATKMSLNGRRKYVIFDEAERMSLAAQDAIRSFIEEFSEACGFIFTCNNKNAIHPAIISRLATIDFSITKAERPLILKQYYKRVIEILDLEEVDYDNEAVANYISKRKNNIDFRNVLIHLQHISKLGKITDENLYHKLDERFLELLESLRKKDFNKMRKWVVDNNDLSPTEFYRMFYDNVEQILKDNKASMASLIMLIGKYQYQSAFVADIEINTASFLVECMVDVEWK